MGREGAKKHCSDGGDQGTMTATSDSRRSLMRRGSLSFIALIDNQGLPESGDSDREALAFTRHLTIIPPGSSKDVSWPRRQNSAQRSLGN